MGQGCGALQECQTRIVRANSDDEDPANADTDDTVWLNIYDLSEEWLLANDIFQEVVELGGAFHAGVEIYGREWSFGYEGVCCQWPKSHDVHVYRSSIPIGHTKYGPEEVDLILEDEMFSKWPGRSYDMLSRNCCSFSRSFCKRLTGSCIPDWVDRLPRALDAVRKPVKGMADVATGMNRILAGSAVSGANHRRHPSVDSEESCFSISSFPSTLEPTPKYDNSEPSFNDFSLRTSASFRTQVSI